MRPARALLIAALGAAVVAVLRFRATEIVGAVFERPLSDGGSRVYMYEIGVRWYERFELWLALAVVLAAASALVRRRAV
jgi:hypothetical protein